MRGISEPGTIPGGTPAEAAAEAERRLMARRRAPPDVSAALAEAVFAACGAMPPLHPPLRAAAAIAAEVDRFGAAFPPGAEPRYHDRYHQAEATLAMGWLCGLARRAGVLDAEEALLGLAAMAAHDLHHPGLAPQRPRQFEEASAAAAADIATAEGAPAAWCENLRRVVLATAMPQPPETARVPLLHRLAHEADVFGSAMPHLGRTLSCLMAEELARAGDPAAVLPATHTGRLAFLSAIPRVTDAAAALGLGVALAWQRDAYALCARSLGAGDTAEAGAAALDAQPAAAAEALLVAALAQTGSQ
ncbi:MAG: hypothetical protein MUC89_00855 [Acetobacteraceae bacterium]|nr:hypothetical protein [Acetobacteraceae bacterium]